MFPISSNTDESSVYVDDVFSTYLYTGNGSTQPITNGIDLAGKGGLVWVKGRIGTYAAYNHSLHDTQRGLVYRLSTNNTNAQSNEPSDINSFNSNGFTLGGGALTNDPSTTYTSWTFRKAAKFFDVVTYTGDGSANRQIAHALGIAPGMIVVKRLNGASNWNTYHRGLGNTAPNGLWLNDTSAVAFINGDYWNSTAPTSSVFTVGGVQFADVNQSGDTYVAYLFAHDTSSTGIIQCGSYTGSTTVTLGWEPQYLLIKQVNSGSSGGWFIVDSMRGFAVDASAYNGDAYLYANQSGAEVLSFGWEPTSTGFTTIAQDGRTMIYMAIRRPNKPPTSGTQVYNAIARAGTGAAATVSGVGFAPDFSIIMERNRGAINVFLDRLRGATRFINSINTAAELTIPDNIFFNQNGITVGADTGGYGNNQASITYINHFFKRTPGFTDVVCYTGTGANTTIPHNLGVVPELMIRKSRSAAANWGVWVNLGNRDGNGVLNSTSQYFPGDTAFDVLPTASTFSPSNAVQNASGVTYVAYLFATLAGISKVGSYTGNNGSQTINCGFAAGARFVLIKRTDAAGDWYVWDTARGITTSAGNDPHLSLSTTAVEVTDDSIDSTAVGFIVKQIAATNINVTSATYIYLAIA